MNTQSNQSAARRIMEALSHSPKAAEKIAREALRKTAPTHDTLFAAGLVALALGKPRDARTRFIRAINTGQAMPATYLNAALAESDLGHTDAAFHLLDKAAARFPDDPQFHETAIKLAVQNGQTDRALALAQTAISIRPDSPALLALAGLAHEAAGDLPSAISALRASLSLREDAQTLRDLSRVEAFTNQPAAALASASLAAKIDPHTPVSLYNLAWREVESGLFDKAKSHYSQVLDDPILGSDALRMMCELADEADIHALSATIDRLQPKHRGNVPRGYLEMARYCLERKADWPSALSHLNAANRLFAKARPYDHRADSAYHAKVLDAYDTMAFSAPTKASAEAPTPIFITGMIRTGTTLLDRLLSAAPEASSLGEVAAVDRFFRTAFADAPQAPLALEPLMAQYARYQALVDTAPFTIDKMPANYMYLGWIARAFPQAKIILIERDFRDMAASAYSSYFDTAPMNFTFREDWLMQKQALYHAQIAGWVQRGVSFHRVTYEALVSSPAETLGDIATFCGLPKPDSLPNAETGGSIRTASFAQARNAINTASIGRWSKFSEALPNICRPDPT